MFASSFLVRRNRIPSDAKRSMCGVRFARRVKVFDANAAGETEPVAISNIGPDLVFGRLWQSMGLREILRDLDGGRKHGFDLERAV